MSNSPKLSDKVEMMTTANVQLIKSIDAQYLDKVQTAVTQAVLLGKTNAELTQQLKAIGNATEARAKFIARDQSSKLNASLTQARHEELGITKYRWSTSGDERVRSSHAENDGKIFSYDDPPETGHPGHDFNCRCVAIAVLDEKIPKDGEKEAAERSQEGEREILPKDLQKVIEIGKNIQDKYQDVLDKAIASGKPYEGVMEIMRREGVELGGKVSVSSLEERAIDEINVAVSRYPKRWVEASNAKVDLVVAEAKGRAFFYPLDKDADMGSFISSIKNNPKNASFIPFLPAVENGMVKGGDVLILSNTLHPFEVRLSKFIHEYGHKLQAENPALNKYFVDYWIKRTENVKHTWYNKELVKDAGFPTPYYGRDYSNGRGEPRPLEMLTMTFEALLGNDPDNSLEKLRKTNPELFQLGLALLTRYK